MADHSGGGRSTRPAPDAAGSLPLVEAKIAVPSIRRTVVERPRITRALDDDDRALTLVAAPAGYGKTTAVRAWCATLDAGLAWVTLDAADNDPSRFWRYIATAVDRVRPAAANADEGPHDLRGLAIGQADDRVSSSLISRCSGKPTDRPAQPLPAPILGSDWQVLT